MCIVPARAGVGFSKGTSGMVKNLRDVRPEGWANLKSNTVNIKAGKKEARPVVSRGAKKLLFRYTVYRGLNLVW